MSGKLLLNMTSKSKLLELTLCVSPDPIPLLHVIVEVIHQYKPESKLRPKEARMNSIHDFMFALHFLLNYITMLRLIYVFKSSACNDMQAL